MKLFHWEILKGRFIVGAARAGFALVMFLAMSLAGDASAQSTVTGVPNAMQGFSQNRDQPIQIEAASLEMRDKKKEATFTGNVKVVQGDTTMTSKVLVVFYESSGQNAAPATAAPATNANAKAAAAKSSSDTLAAQHDLSLAESLLVAAQTAAEKAKVDIDRATGETLQQTGVSIDDAKMGVVSRAP